MEKVRGLAAYHWVLAMSDSVNPWPPAMEGEPEGMWEKSFLLLSTLISHTHITGVNVFIFCITSEDMAADKNYNNFEQC